MLVDPDFGIVPLNTDPTSDDHPPTDVRRAQRLVGHIYNVLLNGGNNLWKRTLLIITYDEHGGFYDHVKPPTAEDDLPEFRNYGVRVPAILVSPFISKGSFSDEVYDHTSIIKTILNRFCSDQSGKIPDMGKRVMKANDLSSVLTLQNPRSDCKPTRYVPIEDDFKSIRYKLEEVAPPTDLQKSLIELKEYCLSQGLMEHEL